MRIVSWPSDSFEPRAGFYAPRDGCGAPDNFLAGCSGPYRRALTERLRGSPLERMIGSPPGGYECLSNDLVPTKIELTEKIVDRVLVDGECLYGDGSDTVFCETPVRWNVETGASEDFW